MKLLSMLLIAVVLAFSAPDDESVRVSDNFIGSSRNPICGVQAMAVAGQSLGKTLKIASLLSSEFVSEERGSTLDDLEKLASQLGLGVFPLAYCEPTLFESVDRPVLLNLAIRANAKCSGHWVTFLGHKNGKWKIYDASTSPALRYVEPGDVLARYRNVALIVYDSDNPPNQTHIFYQANASRLLLVALSAAAIGLATLFFRNGVLATKVLLLIAISATISGIGHGTGFLDFTKSFESAAWMTISGASEATFNGVSYGEIKDLATLKHNKIFLVDAIIETKGNRTIPGAVPIGVDLNIDEFRRRTEQLSSDQKIVVFCNSSKCTWARIVAQRFKAFGFHNVRVYEPGLQGFYEQKKMESSYANDITSRDIVSFIYWLRDGCVVVE